MAVLHDPETRASIRQRVSALRPDAKRRWGKMSIDQMLHHVNIAMENALGRTSIAPLRYPVPKFLMKFTLLYLPWPRGTPTAPEFVVGGRYDFETERTRCLTLIDEIAARPLGGPWPVHSTFGDVTGSYYTRLHAKHLDHHLRQFSA